VPIEGVLELKVMMTIKLDNQEVECTEEAQEVKEGLSEVNFEKEVNLEAAPEEGKKANLEEVSEEKLEENLEVDSEVEVNSEETPEEKMMTIENNPAGEIEELSVVVKEEEAEATLMKRGNKKDSKEAEVVTITPIQEEEVMTMNEGVLMSEQYLYFVVKIMCVITFPVILIQQNLLNNHQNTTSYM
jgi:hypothetical protein